MRLSFSSAEDTQSDRAPTIVYSDNDVVVACKPSGMPTQQDPTQTPDLLLATAAILAAEGVATERPLKLVNRLDRPVGGLVLMTCSARAEKWFTAGNQEHHLVKNYDAIVCGHMAAPSGELTDYLLKNAKDNTSRVVSKDMPKSKRACLFYEVLSVFEGPDNQKYSWLKIRLLTGRHHQIRVQLAHAGCPILGDTKYNAGGVKKEGWNYIALFASQISFFPPKSLEQKFFEVDFQKAEPAAFAKLILQKKLLAGVEEETI